MSLMATIHSEGKRLRFNPAEHWLVSFVGYQGITHLI